MQPRAKQFLELWRSFAGDAPIPGIQALPDTWADDFQGFEIALSHSDEGLVVGKIGAHFLGMSRGTDSGSLAFSGYPAAVRPIQRDLLNPPLSGHFGFRRLSRHWMGHRYQEAEWILLPIDRNDGTIMLIGGMIPTMETDQRDVVDVSDPGFERVIVQEYLSLQSRVGQPKLRPRTWAFLQAMQTEVLLDGTPISGTGGIVGQAGYLAQEVRRASTLFVGDFSPHATVISNLAKRYRMKIVQSIDEAKALLEHDRIDVIITSEWVNGESGEHLIRGAQSAESAIAGGIVILDPVEDAIDRVIESDTMLVQGLVAPVGEYALRLAIDDISSRISLGKLRGEH